MCYDPSGNSFLPANSIIVSLPWGKTLIIKKLNLGLAENGILLLYKLIKRVIMTHIQSVSHSFLIFLIIHFQIRTIFNGFIFQNYKKKYSPYNAYNQLMLDIALVLLTTYLCSPQLKQLKWTVEVLGFFLGLYWYIKHSWYGI